MSNSSNLKVLPQAKESKANGMNDEQRQDLIRRLQQGEELSPEWARILFPPEKREYELVYHDKEREEDIIAETLGVPLQPVRTFGRNGANGWQNMLIFGDNLQVMKTLLDMKKAGKLCNADGTPGVRLIYIDPPFATKQEFRGNEDQKAYQDKIAGAQFLEFLRKRLIIISELLSDTGSLYVHLDWKRSHYMKVLLDEVFGEPRFQNDIAWHYSGWNKHLKTNFNRRWESLLFYSKNPSPLFNSYALAWESKEAYVKARKQEIHREKDGREYVLSDAGNGERVKRYIEEALEMGRPIDDVWDIDKINNSSKEHTGYPTQKPEALLERVISASSKPGDIVLDAFAGSGTTSTVAEKLGRRWISIDCGKLAVYTVQKRMLNLKQDIGNKGKSLTPKPFTLYNAGLYDFSRLRQLPWEDWRFFALQLFGCKDEPHTIGGLHLDGKLKGASVLVFNHLERPGQRMDEDSIRGIHASIGKRIGRKFFVIAPRGVFDFQQDYIDIDEVRYYALRIPYSIINELHQREFTALQQPHDEMSVNETVDAVGFDFIQPPKVDWTLAEKKREGHLLSELCLTIRGFQSTARIRGRETKGDLDTLSMVMVDVNYDGDVFNMGEVVYGQQLSENDWTAWLPIENLGKTLMVVFIDIYGNEAREVITTDSILKRHSASAARVAVKAQKRPGASAKRVTVKATTSQKRRRRK